MNRTATFSTCKKYRYSLWRDWSNGSAPDAKLRYAMFIGLNPSTADEQNDDPTIRRCITFAKDWGYDGLCMTNLFAYRATAPQDMLVQDDPIGPENDEFLINLAQTASVVIAAWGTHGAHLGRDAEIINLLPKLHYLRLTKGGMPGHPLYLPKNLRPIQLIKGDDENH